jgi:hypothetical protein
MLGEIKNEKFIIPIYFIEDEKTGKNIIDEESMQSEFNRLLDVLKMDSDIYLK